MTSTEPRTDIFEHRADEPVSEQLLLQAVRDGSTGAFGVLYARHRSFAVGVARRALAPSATALAEDVAEAAFIDVFTALRNGKGPVDGLRAYLATAVRHRAWRTQRHHRRQADTVERWAATHGVEPAATEPSLPDDDGLGSHALLATAYRGLSERWRHVLWLTEVEGRRPADIAPLLGISAGTAAALAYRARQGLLSAYVAAYRSLRADPACQDLSGRLAELIALGLDAPGFDDVREHLEGCAPCRDLARGVDLAGGLGALAPFGLLSAGWWAKGVAAGGVRLGGALAGGAGAAAKVGGRGAGGGAGGGALGAVAAAVAAVAVVAGAAYGLARDGGSPRPEAAAGATTSAVANTSAAGDASVEAITQDGPAPTATSGSSVPSSEAASPTVDAPRPPAAPIVSRPGPSPSPSTPPSPTTTAPGPTTTLPASTTTLPVSTTSLPVSTTTTPASTTTTVPDVPGEPGALAGRIVVIDPDTGEEVALAGVRVAASTIGGRVEAVTDGEGRWTVASLPSGIYLVVADVPAAYRPVGGLDPWLGGPTWPAVLGLVPVADAPIDLVDLRLALR